MPAIRSGAALVHAHPGRLSRPLEACMFWVPDEDHSPFGRIEVDPYLCIGCQKCISKGPDGAFLDGCPWDAIEMVPTEDWEAMHGVSLPDAPPPPPTS